VSNRAIDRRAVFLVIAAVVCLLLVPATPSGLEYVGIALAIWCGVLALASWLDHRSRGRAG
jgi:hypothetical protein